MTVNILNILSVGDCPLLHNSQPVSQLPSLRPDHHHYPTIDEPLPPSKLQHFLIYYIFSAFPVNSNSVEVSMSFYIIPSVLYILPPESKQYGFFFFPYLTLTSSVVMLFWTNPIRSLCLDSSSSLPTMKRKLQCSPHSRQYCEIGMNR